MMNKYFHNFVFSVSVLPALLVMPAMADVVNVNDTYDEATSLVVKDGSSIELTRQNINIDVLHISEIGGIGINALEEGSRIFVGSETVKPELSIIARRGIQAAGSSSSVDIDAASITVNASTLTQDYRAQGLQAINSGVVSLVSQNGIDITSDYRGMVVASSGEATLNAQKGINIHSQERGILGSGADVSLQAKNINIISDSSVATHLQQGGNLSLTATDDVNLRSGSSIAVVSNGEGSVVDITGKNVNVDGAYGLYTTAKGVLNVDADKLNITASNGDGISAWTASQNNQYIAGSGGKIDIETGDLTVNATGIGLGANYMQSQITVNADGDVNIVAHGSDDTRAIHAGNSTTDPDITKENTSFVSVKAKNINLKADNIGVSAMSNGFVDLDGNVNIEARDAILARGYAHVNINESGENTVKMNGNVNFDYYSKNSGSLINAYVNVNLSNEDSYWTGNTVASYLYQDYPGDEKMEVDSFNLSLSNGAVWNATKITDTSRTFVDESDDKTYSEGTYYIALNNLDIDNGTVNIADTTRGITVENASVAGATFNGGPLNIGSMTVYGVGSTFNTNVSGNTLILEDGATMDIGTNSIVANAMFLDGALNATLLNTNKFATLDVANFTSQDGSMNLTLKGVGDYKVFKHAVFDNSKVALVYDDTLFAVPVWNEAKDTITVSMKPVEEIAANTGLKGETATAVSHVAEAASKSDSVLMQDLSVKMQEKLAENTPEAKAAVEHATKAVHPEKESVVQSVSTSVQNTVVNLASARMATPIVGRNGGDVAFTKGGVWAQGLFNKSKQADAFNGYTRGIALGMDGTINKDWTIGAGYSYAHSDISGTARDTEIDSNTIFVYGQYKPAQWYVNAIANYTMSDYSERGTVLDGAVVTGDYDVDSFGGALAMGYDFANGITPELGLRYMHVNANDYANSYDINTHIDDTDFLTGVIGAKYAFNVVATRHLTLVPQLNAGVKYDLLSDKNTATVAMPGVNAYTIDGNRLKRVGGEFGIGLGMQYRDLELSVNYDIDVREDYTSQTGMLKFRYNF